MSIFRNILKNTLTSVTDTISSYFNMNHEDEIDKANAMLIDLDNNIVEANNNTLKNVEDSVRDNKGVLKVDRHVDCDLTTLTADTTLDAKSLRKITEFEKIFMEFCEKSLSESLVVDEINLDDFDDIFDDTFHTVENKDKPETGCSNVLQEVLHADLTKNTINDLPLVDVKTPNEEDRKGICGSNLVENSVTEESDCDSYHSSDFEWISESEAKREGLITREDFIKRSNNTDVKKSNSSSNRQNNGGQHVEGSSKIPHSQHSSLRPSGSIIKFYRDKQKATEIFRSKGRASNDVFRPKYEFNNRSYRKTHTIPDDNEFLRLFQGFNDPMLQQIHFAENKRVDVSPMTVTRWNLNRRNYARQLWKTHTSSVDEFGDEAAETTEKIMTMHPQENRRCKRSLRSFAK